MQRMKRVSFLILMFGLLLAGCGGGGGGGGGPIGGNTTVSGTVRDSRAADAPVAGARVEIGGVATTTNQDGTFTLRGAQVGASSAIVTAPGGQPQTISFSPPIAAGSNSVPLTINIGQIRGRVVDPQGQPVANAVVVVIATGDTTRTAADGTFLVPDIPATVTDVTAVFGTQAGTRTGVDVQDNGVTDIGDLQLQNDPNPTPPGPPSTINGRLTTGDGGATTGAIVVLYQNGVEVERTTAQNGAYSFYVPVGTYTVFATLSGYQNAQATANVTNPATSLQVDLTLSR